ncbi:MAG: leucine-rich repeat domain-containing protein [Oscillospiraceae bacterium]|nr:leucine-rich repeat domain-containing protein [Oscillospiraceae bacterium]
MKKFIALMLIAALLAGCGEAELVETLTTPSPIGDTPPQEGNDELFEPQEEAEVEEEPEPEQEAEEEAKEFNPEDLEETPENYFTYEYDERLEGMVITRYWGHETTVRIPAMIDDEPVVGIHGTYYKEPIPVFKDNIKYVYIPNTVTSIGKYAFRGCKFLIINEIPDSVTTIGQEAFWGNKSLSIIDIPDSVTNIDLSAFGFSGVTDVTLGSGLKYIGFGAFSNCERLTNVTIKDGVTRISAFVFGECKKLKSIIIPESVSYIGNRAFFGSGLNDIDLHDGFIEIYKETFIGTPWYLAQPEGVVYIGRNALGYKNQINENTVVELREDTQTIANHAFENTNLTSIIIPEAVTHIGSNAFAGSRLTSIAIPDNVTHIGGYAFINCEYLTSAVFGDSVAYIGWDAFANTGITSIVIPDSVIEIKSNAFWGSENLTSVDLGNGVETIKFGAFSQTGITSITIPESVTRLDLGVFDDCPNLINITYKGVSYYKESIQYYCSVFCDVLHEGFDFPQEFYEAVNGAEE